MRSAHSSHASSYAFIPVEACSLIRGACTHAWNERCPACVVLSQGYAWRRDLTTSVHYN